MVGPKDTYFAACRLNDGVLWPCNGLQQLGDADGDGRVEFNNDDPNDNDDYAKSYECYYRPSAYDPCCDFNRDGVVDWYDYQIGLANHGQTGQPCENCQ